MKSKVVLPSVGLINFVIEITMVPNTKYVHILLGRGISDETQVLSSRWKWWQTVLRTKMSCNRWEGSTWAQEIFSFGFCWREGSGGREARESWLCIYFGESVGAKGGASIGDSPMFQKNWRWANQCDFFFLFKKIK